MKVFNETVLNEGRVLVKFGAPWCGPCKMLAPTIEQMDVDGYNVYEVNIEDEPDLAVKYRIRSVPTTIIFENGEPIKTFIGVQTKSTLVEALEG